MRKIFLAAVAVAALPLGACVGSLEDRIANARPVEERIPITVAHRYEVADFEIGADGRLTGTAIAEASRFVAFFKNKGTEGPLLIASTGGSLAANQLRDLAYIAGVPRDRVQMAAPGPGQSRTVRVAFARYVASVANCQDDWSENLASNAANTSYPSFGCAMQTNVAAMAADPRDLLGPQAETPADATRRGKVIEAYRQGQSTAATRAEGDSGKIADVQSGTEKK